MSESIDDDLWRDESIFYKLVSGASCEDICRNDQEREFCERIAPGIRAGRAAGRVMVTSNDPPLSGPDPYGDE
jgi:hypothetical protein